MASKKIVYLAAFVGSTVGSLLPSFWHAGIFSFSSVLLGGIGGIFGIILAYKYL